MPGGTAQIETVDASATGAPIAQELPTAIPHANGNGANGANGYHQSVGSILSPDMPTGSSLPGTRLGVVDQRLPITSNMAPGSSMTTFDDEGEVAMRASVPSNHPASRAGQSMPARPSLPARPVAPAMPAVPVVPAGPEELQVVEIVRAPSESQQAPTRRVIPNPLTNRVPRPRPVEPPRRVVPNPLTNRIPIQDSAPVAAESQYNIPQDGLHGEAFLAQSLPALENINDIVDMTDAMGEAYSGGKQGAPSFPFIKDGKTYWYTFGKAFSPGVYELEIREAYYPKRDKDGTILDAHIVHNGPTLKINYLVDDNGNLKMDSLHYLDVQRDANGNAKSKSGVKEIPLDVARAREITASMIPTRQDLQESWLEIKTAPHQKELRKLERKANKELSRLDKANRKIATLNQQLIDARAKADSQRSVADAATRSRAQLAASIQNYRNTISERNGWASRAAESVAGNGANTGASEASPADTAMANNPRPDTLPQDHAEAAVASPITVTDETPAEQAAQATDEQLTQEQLNERLEQIRRNAATIWAVDQDRSSPAGERFRTTYNNIVTDGNTAPTGEDISNLESAYRDMLAEYNAKYGKFNEIIAGIDQSSISTGELANYLHTALSYAINQNYDLLFRVNQSEVESVTGDPTVDLDIYRSRRLNRILNPRLLSLSQYNGQEMANFQKINELVLQRLRRNVNVNGRTVTYYDLSSLIESR